MILRLRSWELVASRQVGDVNVGQPGVPYTYVLYRRRRDGKHATRRVRGHWTLDELNDDPDPPERG